MFKTSFFLLLTLLLNSCIDENSRQTPANAVQSKPFANSCLTASDSNEIKAYSANGCSGFTVYGSLDSNHLLIVEIDRAYYNLREDCTPIDLQPGTKGVCIKIYERPKGAFWAFPPVCSDIVCVNCRYEVATDEFISGKIYASVSRAKENEEEEYRCTVKVEDLMLRKEGKTQTWQVKKFIFYNVLVGWTPG